MSGRIVVCTFAGRPASYPRVSFWELGPGDVESCRSSPFLRKCNITFSIPLSVLELCSASLLMLGRVCLITSIGNVPGSGTYNVDRCTVTTHARTKSAASAKDVSSTSFSSCSRFPSAGLSSW